MNINTNYTAIALLVDSSGSMQNIKSDVQGSLKQFINEQKKTEGKASLTVAQFDHKYQIIEEFRDIKDVDGDQIANGYNPTGATALLDAIARTIISLTQRIESIPLEERPKRVMVMIITDGEENASREFTLQKIKDMVKEKQGLGWDFVFMGATLDTMTVATNMGFTLDQSAIYSPGNFQNCMTSISAQVNKARLNQEVIITEQERENLIASVKTA